MEEMDSVQLITQSMQDYRTVIWVLAGVITTLSGVIGFLYIHFDKRNRANQDKVIKLIEDDIESRRDLKDAINAVKVAVENNNNMIGKLPDSILVALAKTGKRNG